jgi:hypothetical protein
MNTRRLALYALVAVCGMAGPRLATCDDAPQANAPAAPAPKVSYKGGKDVNFEELLIQGQLKRPEVTVVTGNAAQGTDGMLRLRENFIDRLAEDAGEESAQ